MQLHLHLGGCGVIRGGLSPRPPPKPKPSYVPGQVHCYIGRLCGDHPRQAAVTGSQIVSIYHPLASAVPPCGTLSI